MKSPRLLFESSVDDETSIGSLASLELQSFGAKTTVGLNWQAPEIIFQDRIETEPLGPYLPLLEQSLAQHRTEDTRIGLWAKSPEPGTLRRESGLLFYERYAEIQRRFPSTVIPAVLLLGDWAQEVHFLISLQNLLQDTPLFLIGQKPKYIAIDESGVLIPGETTTYWKPDPNQDVFLQPFV